MAHGTFGTVITCMDGRVQLPVNQWMRERYHLHYVDTITEAGADKALAQGTARVDAIRERAEISVRGHGSGCIAIVGHCDCAGNPVTDGEHLQQIQQAVEVVRSWSLPAEVIGLWVDDTWQVHPLEETRGA